MDLNLDELLANLEPSWAAAMRVRQDWLLRARTRPISLGKQIPPEDLSWEILLFRAGRGFGKTEAIMQHLWWEMWRVPGTIGHIVAPTQSDLRTVSYEGPVGLCSLIPAECLKGKSLSTAYNKTTHEMTLDNGSKIVGFSATENGQRLRGPQCHLLAGDEVAAWDKPAGNLQDAFSNAMFGVRLPYPDGTPARAVLATTPRPIPFLKRLEKRPGVRVVTGTSYENLRNLSPSFRNQLLAMAGTTLGRQEIEAAYVDDEAPAAIIKRGWIKLWPASKPLPEFSYILESYDTAFSEDDFDKKRQLTDPTACVVLGIFNTMQYFDDNERRRLGIRSRYAALLVDCWADRLGFPELLEKAREQHKTRWGPTKKRSDLVLIEQKASGISLRQALSRFGVPTWPYNPGKQDKIQRGHAVAPLVKQGMLFVPESMREDRKGMPRDWVEPFLEEVCTYSGPGSTEHDDQFDALTQALIYLRDIDTLSPSFDEKTIDYEERRERDREEAERLQGRDIKRVENPYAV